MKTLLFFAMCATVLAYLATNRRRPSKRLQSIDAIIPAFNEELCLKQTLRNLLLNPYVAKVICVNDGSTDGTADVLARLSRQWRGRLIAINQVNSGKGGALMHGLRHATAEQVFLTDADTHVPPASLGLGYMLAEIEAGADAVGGVPSSNLNGAGLLPYIRATVKLPMIAMKRTFQQLVGGAPFIISGACGMFRTRILREVGFSDRTKVEDLDLTWTLVGLGYRVRHVNRCIVFPQECNSPRDEWKRWRRWIIGYAVCMRLHWRLIFTRFGLFSILPMFLLVAIGVGTYSMHWATRFPDASPTSLASLVFPIVWVVAVMCVAVISAVHHRKLQLVLLAPLAVFYVFIAYSIWTVYGLRGLLTGREPLRDKPTRYANVVE
jgi:cellulose synthase/poly-beta-1,6-N-acetylglucosamine synthase-like glycosyltransferase